MKPLAAPGPASKLRTEPADALAATLKREFKSKIEDLRETQEKEKRNL